MKPVLSAVIINYKTKHLIKSCIDHLLKQTQPHLEIIFIDNLSQDGSAEFVRDHFPQVKLVANQENLGYAKAANQGIEISHGEFVMILNPDIVLMPDYIEKCLERMSQNQKIAAICGKVKKYDFEANQPTNFIDTVGIYCYRNRRFIDAGQGLEDEGQFEQPHEVFGISGACPIYRRTALEDVKIMGEYLDNDFFMYKEDVDLSWRLNLFGWKCYYDPAATCYHGRGTGVLKRFSHLEVLMNRRKLSRFTKYYSYKNQRLMQVKNELWGNFLLDFFPIIWKEILAFGYLLFFEPYLLKSWWMMLKQMPNAFKKRKLIMQKKRVGAAIMKPWLSGKNKYF